MNAAYYMLVFDKATEVFLGHVGVGRDYTESGVGTVFALEAAIRYERELRLDDDVWITTRLLDHDHKLLHLQHAMHHGSAAARAATMELLLLHVAPSTRRGAPWPAIILERLDALATSHRMLASPEDERLKLRIRRTTSRAKSDAALATPKNGSRRDI
ncbi:MAG: thioesterase family protein [Alphaproteobacteria bacterium]|nr:thioesterase family protein [Alphaproteobacteria bacterium]